MFNVCWFLPLIKDFDHVGPWIGPCPWWDCTCYILVKYTDWLIRLFTQRFPAVDSLNQVTRVKWRRVAQRRTGLVLKDVICLPGGRLPAPPDRLVHGSVSLRKGYRKGRRNCKAHRHSLSILTSLNCLEIQVLFFVEPGISDDVQLISWWTMWAIGVGVIN